MANATFVRDAQRRVSHTDCPLCGQPHLDFSMRCDIDGTDCLFLARCGRCNVVFDLDPESFPPGLTAEHLKGGHVACPSCDDPLAIVTLTCSIDSHSCRYGFACPTCDEN
jgi:hypothetical protein